MEGVPDEVLSDDEVTARLTERPGWALVDGSLHRELEFEGFAPAFACMAQVALAAEKLDHHPDWSNVYKTVVVKLNTHDAGGLTALDFDLAMKMNSYAGF